MYRAELSVYPSVYPSVSQVGRWRLLSWQGWKNPKICFLWGKGFLMGLAELQVAVPKPWRRDGAQLGSKSAARSRICQLSLWAGKALVARGSPVTVSHRAGVWCSRVIDSQKLGFTGERTDQETRKWKYKYHCQPLDTIDLSSFLKKLMKNVLVQRLAVGDSGRGVSLASSLLDICQKCSSFCGCQSSLSCFVLMIRWHFVFRGVSSPGRSWTRLCYAPWSPSSLTWRLLE